MPTRTRIKVPEQKLLLQLGDLLARLFLGRQEIYSDHRSPGLLIASPTATADWGPASCKQRGIETLGIDLDVFERVGYLNGYFDPLRQYRRKVCYSGASARNQHA